MDSNAKATVIAAIIGGLFVCGAAFISLFSPLTGKLVEVIFNRNPTATIAAVVIQPTPTLSSQTTTPSTPPPSQTIAPSAPPVTIIILNDLPLAQTIYINGLISANVEAGNYVTFSYARGKYLLQNCPGGMNPQEHLTDCGSRTEDVQSDPFIWYIKGSVTPDTDVIFIARNLTQLPYDLFVDNKSNTSLDPSKFTIQHLPRGKHTLQACIRGSAPQNNSSTCLAAQTLDLEFAVMPFDITN